MWMFSFASCLAPWDPAWNLDDTPPPDTGDTPSVSEPTGDTGPAAPVRVDVSEDITEDTTWSAGSVYTLKRVIYVRNNAKLTVPAGTTVLGDQGSALIVTNGSALDALGREDAPVVFTSSLPVGSRTSRSWGGVALLGSATVTGTPPHELEGLVDPGVLGSYGGGDDLWSCGRLEYVRIEFAGFDLDQQGSELNGLTLAGCGSLTYVDFVQVHRASDDGVEVFGGTVNMKHVIVTGSEDDGLDWDLGWRGRAQFVVVQQYPGLGERAIEADGWVPADASGTPSFPTLYNVTLFGANDPAHTHTGLHLREGTRAEIRDLLVGWNDFGIDVADLETAANVDAGQIVFSHSLWWEDGTDTPATYFQSAETDDDGGLDEGAWLGSDASNGLGIAPGVTAPPAPVASPWMPDPRVYWIPPAGGAVSDGFTIDSGDGFWDVTNYRGAVAPGTVSPWWEPWASFPEN